MSFTSRQVYGRPTKPTARVEHALAWDPTRRAIFQFGGWDFNVTVFDNLWVYYVDRPEDGWIQVPVIGPKPTARSDAGLVVDTASDRLVMHGGADAGFTLLTDTYAIDLSTVDAGAAVWTNLSPVTTPPARFPVHMVYDSVRDVIVRFGGQSTGFVVQNDTYEFASGDWGLKSPATSPPARFLHSMAFDPVRQKTVVFSGSGGTDALTDTWLWDGTNWEQLITELTPPARVGAPAAYSNHHGGMVVAMGQGLTASTFGPSRIDTWALRLEGWQEIHSTTFPGERDSIPSAGVTHPRGFLMHGGLDIGGSSPLDETWLLNEDEEWGEAEIGLSFDADVIQVSAGARLDDPATSPEGLLRNGAPLQVTGPVTSIAAVSTVPGSDQLLFAVAVDGTAYWWDGTTWTESDLTSTEMTTLATANAALGDSSFPVSADAVAALDPAWRFISASGSTTPELEQVEVTHAEFVAVAPTPPNECIVFGWAIDEDGAIAANALVEVTQGGYQHGSYTVTPHTVSTTANADGFFRISLIETETVSQAVDFKFTFVKQGLSKFHTVTGKIIPNVSTKKFSLLS